MGQDESGSVIGGVDGTDGFHGGVDGGFDGGFDVASMASMASMVASMASMVASMASMVASMEWLKLWTSELKIGDERVDALTFKIDGDRADGWTCRMVVEQITTHWYGPSAAVKKNGK